MNRNFPDISPGLLLLDSEITASLSRGAHPVWIPAQRPGDQDCTVLNNSIIDHEATRREFRQAVVLHGRVCLGDDLLPTATSWHTSPDMAAASHKRNRCDRTRVRDHALSRVGGSARRSRSERLGGPPRRAGDAGAGAAESAAVPGSWLAPRAPSEVLPRPRRGGSHRGWTRPPWVSAAHGAPYFDSPHRGAGAALGARGADAVRPRISAAPPDRRSRS